MKKDEIAKLVSIGINELNTALAEGRSVRLEEVLKLMARFNKYSFNNCLLIAQQFPDATKVMGFHGWKSVGRSVKKGEKGIGITAPLAFRKKDAVADEKEIRGFRVVHVFDISQTEGDELPSLTQPTGSAAQWIEPVERLIESKGIELQYGLLDGGAYGVSSVKKIAVLSGLKPPMRLEVLIHELAHELLHPDRETRKRLKHAVMETEAQAVAQVVCQALGMEAIEHSADYIHLHNGNSEVFANSMTRIQKCASGILTDLLGNKQPTFRRSDSGNKQESKPLPTLAA
ncbi:MAG: ArdC-like ssDNA-binding domain-containing protein [Planctomycetota bacterium]